jgi:DNA-binding NarL/FixJ family response regulator
MRTTTRSKPARILIADDHDLVRGGYQLMLDREPDLEVVGEASNGREAVELCQKLLPDLVLMDVRMPEMDGIEATRKIKSELPTISVLVVTTYDNPDYLFEAVEAGAAGYVLKDAPRRQLLDAVRRTLSGESPSPALAAGFRRPRGCPKSSRPHRPCCSSAVRRRRRLRR